MKERAMVTAGQAGDEHPIDIALSIIVVVAEPVHGLTYFLQLLSLP
jgi:hypothetical protein